jgi:ketosteroid isomerase-like protein
MKRKGVFAVFCLVVSLVTLSACQPATETNRSAQEANTNAGKETVDTASIQAELMRIENDWPRVIKEKDVAAVQRVEADDAVFIYPDGSMGDRAQDIKDMESGALSADSWEVTDLKVNVLDKDSAVVSGRSIVKNGKYKTPDGKSIDISGQYRFIDTFARRNGEWKLVAGASVPVRQPAAAASPATSASPAAKTSPATAASPATHASPATKASPAAKTTP